MYRWLTTRYRVAGIFYLGTALALLLWQAAPHHQFTISHSSFLVAHSIMEIFAIVVAATIFFTAYGEQDFQRSNRAILLSYAALASGLFDMLHMLAYIGMPDLYSHNTANKSILFWLMARIVIAIGLLVYILVPDKDVVSNKRRRIGLVLTIVGVLVISALALRYLKYFPATFIPGEGLTLLKIILEWGLFFFLTGIAMLLYVRQDRIVDCDVDRLMLAILLMAVSELFFTLYVKVSNTANMLGHVYKVIAYYYLYGAVFTDTIRRPFRQIEYMLVHDPVTKLPNRRGLVEQINRKIMQGRRASEKLALFLINLDHFNSINAIFGHEVGDQLLSSVAERIHDVVMEEAFIARFSNDEFAVLLPYVSDKRIEHIGRAIQQKMREGFLLGNDHVETSASIGIVIYPEGGKTTDELLRHASQALRHARQTGRNGLTVFSASLSSAIERSHQLENGLKKAIEENEFTLLYQPKVDLKTGRIVGAEALLRWHSQELGNVSPQEFIPVAEDTGQILAIGDWVMLETCLQIGRWYARGLEIESVAVNVSPRQFRQKDFVEKVRNVVDISRIPESKLEIEITESAIMDNIDFSAEMLEELSRLGFRIALDDFGTGYSSLAYLKTFVLDALKIDRSFISDIPADKDDAMLVLMIITLALSLNLKVIAEGVETQEQLQYLRDCNCDQIQGYYFSRPVTAEEFEVMLRERRCLDSEQS